MDRLGWQRTGGTSLVVGTLLVVAGIALFLLQHVRVDLGQYGWPLFVIAPGLALIAAGLMTAGASILVVGGLGEAALPVALILLGLVLLATTVTSRRPAGPHPDAPAPPPSEPPPAS